VSQINVNPPPGMEASRCQRRPISSRWHQPDHGADRAGVLAIIAWYLFTGPLRTVGSAVARRTSTSTDGADDQHQSAERANPAPGGSNNPPSNNNPRRATTIRRRSPNFT